MPRSFITIILILFYGYATSWGAPSEDIYSNDIYSEDISLKEPNGYPFPTSRQSKAMGVDALPSEPKAVATVPVSDDFSIPLILFAVGLVLGYCRKKSDSLDVIKSPKNR